MIADVHDRYLEMGGTQGVGVGGGELIRDGILEGCEQGLESSHSMV